jgi:hypothetical protein
MSDTQPNSSDSLRRLFSQLHEPATGASFERELMQKVRIAALKKQQASMWELKSTLIAAAAAAAIAAAAWAAMAALREPLPLFEAAAQRCTAGLQELRSALFQKDAICLMAAALVVALTACLPGKKSLSAWNF